MQCEICGNNAGKGNHVLMDGVEMIACNDCAKLGVPIQEKKQATGNHSLPMGYSSNLEQIVLVDDFGKRIKTAREKKQLTFKDLSHLAKEKTSVLKNIESGHLEPNIELAKRLELALGVKIIEKN